MGYSICLDPGHGGYDPGACGNNLRECDITLDIVLKLKPLLENNGINVILTRDGDYAPNHLENQLNDELQARCDIANSADVDLFLSVHVNSAENTQANGGEVLIQGTGGNAEKFADLLLPEIINATEFYDRNVKTQNVMVLRNTNMSAVLSENGFISNEDNANNLSDSNFRQKIAIAHAKAICEYFGITYSDSDQQSTSTTQSTISPNQSDKITILGTETISVEQCNQFIKKVNPNALDIAQYYKKYGEILGIKWGYAFAQMVIETSYLRFGGDVLSTQNNYCGLGTTGGGVKGAIFDTPELGVLAHLEHLYAYCSTNDLPSNLTKIDPRFDLVTRGIATYLTDLNGKWAVPGNSYGENIIDLYNKITEESVSDILNQNPIPVSLKFSYPNNAKIVNDDLYIRDENGTQIQGHYVSNGDNVTILDVSGSKQLCLVEYPTPSGVNSGYVTNATNCIQYYYQGQWANGSTEETVYDEDGNIIGSINPYETATPLYRKNGLLHVAYNTYKGRNCKSGYVKYDGNFSGFNQ